MDLNPLTLATEADYDQALAEVEGYFVRQPEPGTLEAARFDALSALIEIHEGRFWPIVPAKV